MSVTPGWGGSKRCSGTLWLGPDISLPDFIVSTCIYLQPWFMAIRIDDLDQCSHALFLLLVHWHEEVAGWQHSFQFNGNMTVCPGLSSLSLGPRTSIWQSLKIRGQEAKNCVNQRVRWAASASTLIPVGFRYRGLSTNSEQLSCQEVPGPSPPVPCSCGHLLRIQ